MNKISCITLGLIFFIAVFYFLGTIEQFDTSSVINTDNSESNQNNSESNQNNPEDLIKEFDDTQYVKKEGNE